MQKAIPTFTHKTHLNKMPVEQNYSQLPLRKEVDDEGRICSLALPKTEDDEFCENSDEALPIREKREIPIREKRETPIKSKRGRKKGAKKVNWGKTRTKSGKTRKKYKCDKCPGVFYTDHHTKTHAKLHEAIEEGGCEYHTCSLCGIVFAKLFFLMRHRIESHGEALQCPYCHATYTDARSYSEHVRYHTREKTHVCKECGKAYASRLHLENHVRTHTGEKPFMCGYCEKTFYSLGNLTAHSLVHTATLEEREKKRGVRNRVRGEKMYPCNECGKMYDSPSNLEQHMNVHTNAKPYACDQCDARFNFKSGLAVHKVTHTGVYPFKCDLCPAAFYQKIALVQHKVVHTGIKPFKCDLCDYACTRKVLLEYHKNIHTGETPFKCDFYGCTAAYHKPASLRKHKVQHGQPPRTCKYCHEKFKDLPSLKRHIMVHTGEKPISCNQCDKTFCEKGSLKRHMYSHMPKPPGTKTKYVRQPRKNPGGKKKDKSIIAQQKWESEYQVPADDETGHSIFSPSLNSLVQNTNNQPSSNFTASQFSSMVNNAWPSAMNPDELRQRLLSSFK